MDSAEHFVTLFDTNYLPYAVALHRSLMNHCRNAQLWIICMDDSVSSHIKTLALENVQCLPLHELENTELINVKNTRTRGEYCWTITPFSMLAVFERNPAIKRLTYIDSDIFFFDSPQNLLAEMDLCNKQVLITEHAFAPEYDVSAEAGRFCVQFVSCINTNEAKEVIEVWSRQCLEWCFDRFENGKFGDQKYLDAWPEKYPHLVHVVEAKARTLGPWNVHYFGRNRGDLHPVFYHFQGLRFLDHTKVRLFSGYKVGMKAWKLYRPYIQQLAVATSLLKKHGIAWTVVKPPKEPFRLLRHLKRRLTRTIAFAKLSTIE